MLCKCSGRDLPALEIVDRVAIPADLPASILSAMSDFGPRFLPCHPVWQWSESYAL